MEMRRVLICVALMAIVTYIPRVLPLTLFRKPIRSKYIRSFLDYTPYAVLGAMTFPDVFFSTGSLASAALGTAAASFAALAAATACNLFFVPYQTLTQTGWYEAVRAGDGQAGQQSQSW